MTETIPLELLNELSFRVILCALMYFAVILPMKNSKIIIYLPAFMQQFIWTTERFAYITIWFFCILLIVATGYNYYAAY